LPTRRDLRVTVVDEDLGRSGASADGRLGFKELVAEVGLGHVGIVLALEVSRFGRSSAEWHQLLDLCALTATLIADFDGIYRRPTSTTGRARAQGHEV
jgi:DNA invertase Pin-like site-specific DNA recombinase